MSTSEERQFCWLNDLTINVQNNLRELRESLNLINSFQTNDDIEEDQIEELRNSLAFIEYFIRNEPHLFYREIRRLVNYIRKLST